MAEFTVRFVTSNDLVSKAIREVTWCEFSHVEQLWNDGRWLGAHHDGGVQLRPADYAQFTREERYTVSITDEQKFQADTFAMQQIGKAYDTTAIFGVLAHRDWTEDDSWFCSELVAATALAGGFPLLHAPQSRINRLTPRDVYLSPLWMA